jgi:uncharacterized protein (TIGR02391 family)
MGETMAAMYNMFMTIANLPSASDQEKVEKILFLLKTIVKRYDQKKIEQILQDGQYLGKVPIGEVESKLPSHFHQDVLRHGEKLFNGAHYASCINEVCKAYNKVVQQKSGISRDGQDLMMTVFGDKGNLRINNYSTDTEKNEQEGLKFLSAGVMRGFRNPTSHEPSLSWPITKEECLEILGLLSFLFRQLDKTTKTP